MLTAADAAVEMDHVRILNRRAPAAQRPKRKPIFEDPKSCEQDKAGQPDAGKKLQELVMVRDEKTGENRLVVEYREERA